MPIRREESFKNSFNMEKNAALHVFWACTAFRFILTRSVTETKCSALHVLTFSVALHCMLPQTMNSSKLMSTERALMITDILMNPDIDMTDNKHSENVEFVLFGRFQLERIVPEIFSFVIAYFPFMRYNQIRN